MKSQAHLAADEHVIAERDGFHVCIRTPLHGGGCTWKPTSKAATGKVLAVLNVRRCDYLLDQMPRKANQC